jgi:serine/threonine-protein kinase
VSARFLAGVGAWLLGAGAATGGSLLAVSALGQGLAPAPTQQLTVAAVSQALASEAAEATRSAAPVPPVSPSATPLARRHRKSSPTPSVPPPTPASQPVLAPPPATTDLTSVGGSVVASCQPAGAYLAYWSPAQGYEVARDIRGPAATAQVTFAGSRKLVTMTISCHDGAPSASTAVTWGDE